MEKYATTHEAVPLVITTNRSWWQFWKPKQITITVRATVNKDLGVALSVTRSDY